MSYRTEFLICTGHGLGCLPRPDGTGEGTLLPDAYREDEARELSSALELYKLLHRRACLTFEDMVGVLHELGYRKTMAADQCG